MPRYDHWMAGEYIGLCSTLPVVLMMGNDSNVLSKSVSNLRDVPGMFIFNNNAAVLLSTVHFLHILYTVAVHHQGKGGLRRLNVPGRYFNVLPK